MPRPAHRLALAAGLALVSLPAAASDPLTTFCVPRQVDLLPDADTATRVVIHGAFFQLTAAASFSFSGPKCGVMYFECPAGQEAMCRMQWKELRTWYDDPIHRLHCAGFGSRNVVGTAAVRAEGEPLGTPDRWDLGMGIGVGQHVDGKCPIALQLQCPAPASDAGAAPLPATDAVAPSTDAPADTGADADPVPDAGTGGTPPPVLGNNRNGCALAGGAGSASVLAALGLGAVALARRRRR
jgi:hypothetical protein